MSKRLYYLVGVFFFAGNCFAEKPDSIDIHRLGEVVVKENLQKQQLRSAVPIQQLDQKNIENLNVLQVSDAVKHFAGVTVKDYGGTGGLKTVSLRSLGAEHTAVAYDGIAVSNTQTGQIDIGRFSLDNVKQLSLINGQSDRIFQPAKAFASAGIINIETRQPNFSGKSKTNMQGSIKAGSWGLINPSLFIEQKLTNKWAVSLNGEWMSTKGNYPYTLHYGNENDSTSREKRKNSEVKTFRSEIGLSGKFSDTETLNTKIYYYQSSRGLPGATTLYNDFSNQHLWDKNTFVQSQYKKQLNRQWSLLTTGKWNWSYQRYLDADYKNEANKQDNSYYQQEYYLSAAIQYQLSEHFSFSFANDGSINTLNTNLEDFAYPTRYSWLSALAGKYIHEQLTITASVLSTAIYEKTKIGATAGNHHRMSPFVGISFKPMIDEDFYIRAFYKDIFRLPSFNDLYYSNIGNADLCPEKTQQYNVGITYGKQINRFIPYISASIDAYYNQVKDKIIATPTKNIFIWSMVNLGKVDIKGIDGTASVDLQPNEKIKLNLSGNYTYQRALDVTDSNGKTYEHQIAYTPRVFGSGRIIVETPWINAAYTMLHSGKRYVLGQNIEENKLASYQDHSISAGREINLGKIKTTIQVEMLNILNKNYEIVRYFPMPGRSFRVTVKITK